MIDETVLTELREVLRRKIGVSSETSEEFEAFLRRHARVVTASRAVPAAGLDTADAAVLAEAVAAAAEVLVTGDRDLLNAVGAPVEIVSPRGLWEKLRAAP